MGINARFSDNPTEAEIKITEENEKRDYKFRKMVIDGEMTLDEYLMNVKGFQPHHLPEIRERFRTAIFGK